MENSAVDNIIKVTVSYVKDEKRYDEVMLLTPLQWRQSAFKNQIELFKVHTMITNAVKAIEAE